MRSAKTTLSDVGQVENTGASDKPRTTRWRRAAEHILKQHRPTQNPSLRSLLCVVPWRSSPLARRGGNR